MIIPITVRTQIDEPIFRRFSLFDTFTLKRRWVRPVVFAAILLAFSVACFLMTDRAQNIFLGCALMLVGLGLPVAYIGIYLSSVRGQVAKLKLEKPQWVYSLELTPEQVTVSTPDPKEKPLACAWADVRGAYRVDGCIYLYITPTRAFLIPDGQANVSADEAWTFMQYRLDEKAVDKRRRKRKTAVKGNVERGA